MWCNLKDLLESDVFREAESRAVAMLHFVYLSETACNLISHPLPPSVVMCVHGIMFV
jgi:hypothetical protein